jgi:hypothetical protein
VFFFFARAPDLVTYSASESDKTICICLFMSLFFTCRSYCIASYRIASGSRLVSCNLHWMVQFGRTAGFFTMAMAMAMAARGWKGGIA